MSKRNSHVIASLRGYIDEHCIARVPVGSRELPSIDGKGFYRWQFYLRSSLLKAEHLNAIASIFWNRYEASFKESPFQLAGVESASLPIITALLIDADRRGVAINAFSIRKNRKAYGLRNIIEGTPNDLPVVFVDDLVSPLHNAFWHSANVIRSQKLRFHSFCFVIVMKAPKADAAIISTSVGDVQVDYIFDLDDFDLKP